ncbi:MAG: ImmA/IrrE family metallo-endopeptidase [Clostridia bacterium]
MIKSDYIYQKANDILANSDTKDPIRIAKSLGITVHHNDEFEKLLGLYTVINNKRAIVLNSRLEEYMTRMVVAHEIGHDCLHRDIAKSETLQEFVLFDMKNNLEYEANVFAAHLLIDTNEFLKLAYDGVDAVNMSQRFCVNINLVLMKANDLIHLGYDLRMPMQAKSNFMKDIKI